MYCLFGASGRMLKGICWPELPWGYSPAGTGQQECGGGWNPASFRGGTSETGVGWVRWWFCEGQDSSFAFIPNIVTPFFCISNGQRWCSSLIKIQHVKVYMVQEHFLSYGIWLTASRHIRSKHNSSPLLFRSRIASWLCGGVASLMVTWPCSFWGFNWPLVLVRLHPIWKLEPLLVTLEMIPRKGQFPRWPHPNQRSRWKMFLNKPRRQKTKLDCVDS